MGNGHILVVDDEAEVRDLLQEYLSKQGFRISTAESVPAARTALEGEAFGAICFQAILSEAGEAIIFEVNARFGGGYPLAHHAGAHFAKWLIEIASGQVCSASNDWRENVLMLRYDAALFFETYEQAPA